MQLFFFFSMIAGRDGRKNAAVWHFRCPQIKNSEEKKKRFFRISRLEEVILHVITTNTFHFNGDHSVFFFLVWVAGVSGFSWEIKTSLSHGRLEEHPGITGLVCVFILNLNEDGLCSFHGWKKKIIINN